MTEGEGPLGLVAAVRDHGVVVGTDAALRFTEALGHLDLGAAASLYWAGRVTLVADRDDLAAYDAAFVGFVSGGTDEPAEPIAPEGVAATAVPVPVDPGADRTVDEAGEEGLDDGERTVVASATERLADRDFARCTPAELAELAAVIDRLRWPGPTRRSRRLERRGPGADRLDLRRTAAAALATDGELLTRHHRSRATRPRRLVLLVDVSGSMEPYARMLLRFAHVAVTAAGRVEAFTMGTRLTRVTRALAPRDPDVALAAASALVADWSGGTRLADGIGGFVDEWGRRGMARGSTVVILSDGWERGDPAALGERMRQLSLLAHQVVWVNPLRASPGYAPLAGGMAAALPHVDRFVDGHSLASLTALAEAVT